MLGGAKKIGDVGGLTKLMLAVPITVGGLVVAVGGPAWVAVTIAAIGVIGAVLEVTVVAARQRAERREHVASLFLRAPITPARVRDLVASGDLYRCGVAPESPVALSAAGFEPGTHAPYLGRDEDAELCERLRTAADTNGASLILVRGLPKSGKSRTLLEGVKSELLDSWLLAVRDAGSLAELAGTAQPPKIGPGSCIIWLDDIERFVPGPGEPGLDVATLEALGRWKRPILILGTVGGKTPGGGTLNSAAFEDPLLDLVRSHPPVDLRHEPSSSELTRLRALDYSAAAVEAVAQQGIGVFLVAASDLVHRLERAGEESPEGLAVVRAAVDWRRAGLIRPIPRDVLEPLHRHYMGGQGSSEGFERGLEYARTQIYPGAALLAGAEELDPYDFIVLHEEQLGRPIPRSARKAIIASGLGAAELAAAGLAAVRDHEVDLAEVALRAGYELGSGVAAANLGMLLYSERDPEERDTDEIEQILRTGDEVHGDARSAYNLGVLLKDRAVRPGGAYEGQAMEEAERAWQRAFDRGDALAAPSLGMQFCSREEFQRAEEIWEEGVSRGEGRSAGYLGKLLYNFGREEDATRTWRRGDQLGDASSALNLGKILVNGGDLTEAQAAWQRAIDFAQASGDPETLMAAELALQTPPRFPVPPEGKS